VREGKKEMDKKLKEIEGNRCRDAYYTSIERKWRSEAILNHGMQE
jgi:hypothetical protein